MDTGDLLNEILIELTSEIGQSAVVKNEEVIADDFERMTSLILIDHPEYKKDEYRDDFEFEVKSAVLLKWGHYE